MGKSSEEIDTNIYRWKVRINSEKFHSIVDQFQKGLLKWFEQNGRDLPWRKTHDPYSILVSELMLQQTQVDRVIDFYKRFLKRFPNFESIAEASEDEVIELWEGLGYYNRARNLRKCALIIQEEYKGQFPLEREQILALPGIGEYTAGAIMSFALNIRAPIVDTNVDRVLSRIFLENTAKLKDTEKTKILWILSEAVLPESQFWAFNQGIMDFGALQCLIEKPKCNSCPFTHFCKFYNSRTITRFFSEK